MQVEIWSDVICPWCYIGKRHFEAALAQFPQRDSIDIIWRSFELDPDAPQFQSGSLEEMLSRKYGVSLERAAEMNTRVSSVARDAGLNYRLDKAKPGNTFNAHRLLHFAGRRQLGAQATERIMQAYFCEGLPVGNPTALAKIAPEFGISEDDSLAMLHGNDFTDAVRADEARAAALGIGSVPFFVFNGKLGVSGAQPVATFNDVLNQATTT